MVISQKIFLAKKIVRELRRLFFFNFESSKIQKHKNEIMIFFKNLPDTKISSVVGSGVLKSVYDKCCVGLLNELDISVGVRTQAKSITITADFFFFFGRKHVDIFTLCTVLKKFNLFTANDCNSRHYRSLAQIRTTNISAKKLI